MNPCGLTNEISIKSTNNDSRVAGLQLMQANKMFAIQGEHRTSQAHRERQHEIVFNRLFCFSRLKNREHIVPQLSQFLHHWLWKVLVGIQPCHSLRILVVANLLFDF